MLVTIVSYIIILIQFKLQGLMETQNTNSSDSKKLFESIGKAFRTVNR